ncbi:hypothetical protein ACE1ET_04550 [Saccharicrinis sp. FJH62]|uniref:hypothetical protein n=1 Tax=Saccharicrinis sp. FJH62 TaxID=3344657 RepID=UPI0035D4E214
MKKFTFNLSFLFIVTLIVVSCSTGKKALEHGDYYSASLQAINRLRSKPDSKNARMTLEQSYPYALDFYKNQIDAAMRTEDPLKYSKIVDYYGRMNHLADEIDRCPAAKSIIPTPRRYYSEIAEAKKLGAEERYQLGMTALGIGTRQAAKEAYYHFVECNKLIPGFKDVNDKLDESKYMATLKVLLEQIPVPGSLNEVSSEFFYNQVMEHLKKSYTTEFVRFMSPQELDAEDAQPDQYLRMKFEEFVMGQVYDKEKVEDVSKDSVVVGQVTLEDGTKLDAYNTVKAKLTTFHRELSSHGVLDVILVDTYNNQVIAQRKFPGDYVWATEWGSFSGDERALSAKQLALTKQKPVPPPAPQQLFIEFTKPIYNQVTTFLANYFKQQ